ncbi:MAG: triose-phosphate isomerase [Bdellovibrionota bacterium]
MSKAILAGNWKLHKTRKDVAAFFETLSGIETSDKADCYIAPSPVLLETAVRESAKLGNKIKILSQNVAYKAEGALTGEISVKQLLELGVVGSLVAHSERRQFFGESDQSAAERCKIGLENGLKIIFCIGENLEERRHGRFESVIESQIGPLFPILQSFKKDWLKENLILAYEPVWAIGTGVVASEAEIETSHKYIADLCTQNSFELDILYGGSVKPDNFAAISKISKVSGALVGGASLDPKSYTDLLACLA